MRVAIERIAAGLAVCLVAVTTAPMLLSASADSPAVPPPFLLKWGTIGSEDGQFSQPQSIAIDASGNVYVSDTGNHRIQEFTGTGVFITSWGGASGSDNGSFSQPHGVALDASGDVYVADTGNNRIQKFTDTGVFITTWGAFGSDNGSFSQPQGVVVDALGNVYVADTSNHRIQKFTGDGEFITQWGDFGSDNASFSRPEGLALDLSGNIYVVDTGNHRIQKFTSSGVFITKWGDFGSFDGQFFEPRGIAVDASGDVYVAATGNQRIQKFTGFGTFITSWGTQGPGDGEFMYPWAVAVDAPGNVYVADTSNSRIQVFGYPPPPAVTTNSADNITATSARLNGRLTDIGAAASANVSFQWGTSTVNYTNETSPVIMLAGGNFSAELNNLSANTTYYFRAKAVGNGTAYGSNIAFSTQAAPPDVSLTVYENIVVADSPIALPPVILTLNEAIAVIDAPQALPPVSLIVYESVSVTDSPTVPPRLTIILGGTDESGDGDGGPRPGFTFVDSRSTDQGVFTQAFTANSDDGKADFHISQGVTGRTRQGDRLTEVSVVPMAIPPSPPADSNMIGLTYDFGPEGATFSLPITITIKYDPAGLPAAVDEKDMVIAFYDKSTGRWVVLDGIKIDPITHTISGKINHFTPFSIVAYTRPVVFTPGLPAISTREITPGDDVAAVLPAPTTPTQPVATQQAPTQVATTPASPVPSPAPSFTWWQIIGVLITITLMVIGVIVWRARLRRNT